MKTFLATLAVVSAFETYSMDLDNQFKALQVADNLAIGGNPVSGCLPNATCAAIPLPVNDQFVECRCNSRNCTFNTGCEHTARLECVCTAAWYAQFGSTLREQAWAVEKCCQHLSCIGYQPHYCAARDSFTGTGIVGGSRVWYCDNKGSKKGLLGLLGLLGLIPLLLCCLLFLLCCLRQKKQQPDCHFATFDPQGIAPPIESAPCAPMTVVQPVIQPTCMGAPMTHCMPTCAPDLGCNATAGCGPVEHCGPVFFELLTARHRPFNCDTTTTANEHPQCYMCLFLAS